MSSYSTEYLHTHVYTGYREKRGPAWHGGPSCEGPIPNDVALRFLDYEIVESPMLYRFGDEIRTDDTRKVLVHSKTGQALGAMGEGWKAHSPKDYFLEEANRLELGLSSIVILRHGGQVVLVWEMPDNVETPEGITFRPNLTCFTSFDGSWASGMRDTYVLTVCDNTADMAMGERGQAIRKSVRHTRHSTKANILDGFGMLTAQSDAISAELKAMCETEVTPLAFSRWLDLEAPVPTGDGASKRGITVAETKREALTQLWKGDGRVSPWAGTAFGVLQAANTFRQHNAQLRGVDDDADKGMLRRARSIAETVTGKTATADGQAMANLNKVLASV